MVILSLECKISNTGSKILKKFYIEDLSHILLFAISIVNCIKFKVFFITNLQCVIHLSKHQPVEHCIAPAGCVYSRKTKASYQPEVDANRPLPSKICEAIEYC